MRVTSSAENIEIKKLRDSKVPRVGRGGSRQRAADGGQRTVVSGGQWTIGTKSIVGSFVVVVHNDTKVQKMHENAS